jgi:CubicO group peptidase (beta-lactamase class C family)
MTSAPRPLKLLCLLCSIQFAARAQTEDLAAFLEPLRAKNNFPALAAAVVRNHQTIALGVTGFRKSGGTEKVTPDDKFHIGSCTKSMTATLAGILVEHGKISWTTTIIEIFPELKATLHPDYQTVTLEQLLSHRGGVPTDLNADGLWGRLFNDRRSTPSEQRMNLIRGVLTKPPAVAPGTKYLYSNAGVSIAGMMLERVGKVPWETLIKQMLFDPLGMTSAGFGVQASPGKTDQPWPHLLRDGKPVPVPPGDSADNPPAIAPAGTVHCSIGDLAKYVALHAHGEQSGTLLKPDTMKKLHRPMPGQEYALGWIVVNRPWGGGAVLNHAGSNTMNYTLIWIAPKKDFGVIVETNIAGKGVDTALDQIVGELIQKYLVK